MFATGAARRPRLDRRAAGERRTCDLYIEPRRHLAGKTLAVSGVALEVTWPA